MRGMNPCLRYLEVRDHVNFYSISTIERVLRRNGYSHTVFARLHLIQSVSGSRNPVPTLMRNLLFQASKEAFWLSSGKLNVDNLFVVAGK